MGRVHGEDEIIDVNVLYDNNDQIDNEQGRFVQAEEAQTVIISDVEPAKNVDLAGPSHKDPVPLTSDFDAGPGDDEENEKMKADGKPSKKKKKKKKRPSSDIKGQTQEEKEAARQKK